MNLFTLNPKGHFRVTGEGFQTDSSTSDEVLDGFPSGVKSSRSLQSLFYNSMASLESIGARMGYSSG